LLTPSTDLPVASETEEFKRVISLNSNFRRRGPRVPNARCWNHGSKVLVQENRKLQRENARLRKQLSKAEIIIDFQKKAAALFETTMEIEES